MSVAIQNPNMMTPEQAAAYLGVKVETLNIWRCTRRYPLSYCKVGRSVRYKLSELDRFVESRTVAPSVGT